MPPECRVCGAALDPENWSESRQKRVDRICKLCASDREMARLTHLGKTPKRPPKRPEETENTALGGGADPFGGSPQTPCVVNCAAPAALDDLIRALTDWRAPIVVPVRDPASGHVSLFFLRVPAGVGQFDGLARFTAHVETHPGITFIGPGAARARVLSQAFLAPNVWWLDDGAHVVDSLATGPTVRHTPAGYVSPLRGHTAALRLYTTAPSIAPARTSHLLTLLEYLNVPPADTARYVTFLLGSLLRSQLDILPGLLVRSPYKGTGKTTLCELAATVAAGAPQAPMSWRGNTEFSKVLGAAAVRGQNVFWFDNLKPHRGLFASATLAGLITSKYFSERMLGESTMLCVSDPIVIGSMQSGTVDDDLADRLLHVYLPAPPPKTLDRPDARLYARTHAAAIRGELFHLLQTSSGPLPNDHQAPTRFRYHELYRHAVPVLRRLGLDESALAFDSLDAARPINLELARLLAEHRPSDPQEILHITRANHGTYPWLLAEVSHGIPEATALCRIGTLLANLPPAVPDGAQTYCVARTNDGHITSEVI